MQRANDKYGRGSAAVNGVGFVDLEPGDKTRDEHLDVHLAARPRQFKMAVSCCEVW